jgi:diacylglycerol kinase (ATP)
MRAAAIFGLGSSESDLKVFQTDSSVQWMIGLPALPADADVVLVLGGDGTIHRHLSQLVKLGRPVLMVPCGSGNDFARALNLGRVQDSVRAWERLRAKRDNVTEIDLGVIQPTATSPERSLPTYFCCVGGCGLDAQAGQLANRMPSWLKARGGYVLSLAAALLGFRPIKMKITVKDAGIVESPVTRSPVEAMLLAFANATSYGGGMRIAPQAKLRDGLLDFCLVKRVGKLRLSYLFPSVYFGRHLTVPEVEYFKAARLRLETDAPADIFADGEYVCSTPVEVSIAPRALKVVTG